jgi:hypothetical protein
MEWGCTMVGSTWPAHAGRHGVIEGADGAPTRGLLKESGRRIPVGVNRLGAPRTDRRCDSAERPRSAPRLAGDAAVVRRADGQRWSWLSTSSATEVGRVECGHRVWFPETSAEDRRPVGDVGVGGPLAPASRLVRAPRGGETAAPRVSRGRGAPGAALGPGGAAEIRACPAEPRSAAPTCEGAVPGLGEPRSPRAIKEATPARRGLRGARLGPPAPRGRWLDVRICSRGSRRLGGAARERSAARARAR